MAKPAGFALRGWLMLTWAIQPLLPWHLKKRLARGKEHPVRWREKLGHASAERPAGRLVWLHAIGLGEVLALRGLIARLALIEPDLHFLVTSGTRASAEVFAQNLPPRTQHQFAPLDAPGPARRFLAHWRPDLSIWAEQELWPGLVYRTARRGVPLALVNARMNAAAFARRRKGAALYRDILPRFTLVSAQDTATAGHLRALGAQQVRIDGSLKTIAPPLTDLPGPRTALAAQINGRPLWLAASTHPEDEAFVLAAHKLYLEQHPDALLILAPRLPDRAGDILATIRASGLTPAQRSIHEAPTPETQVYLADTFGEMGLFYRLARVAFVGGSMGAVEGHNPWEPVALGCAVLHGPHTANFAADYAALKAAQATKTVETPDALKQALTKSDTPEMAARALRLRQSHMDRLDTLCEKLVQLL
ncbi:3-deoxy-D-manno-octulosonic acid transferase [Aquicoccus sp. G2-2]|uniref:3-deoxy-D-manno-octulosonic acid transferase n=1 Tax=Aquicoccus sp. G2-2 TaxID=3092120 RepID=UPI002ADF32F8|nr:glycosyltransferase N-terminal domain-containing protein [Aquicoccus sp. G2-2]MEA1114516.1 glycosyltransferase N-terminal domain-containing protein [Aquicoccus sp. G2-2]